MADVAKQAGVSKNAVSLALRHDPRIPAVTRERILRVCRQMGYRPNPTVGELMARLRKGRHPAARAPLALINANRDPQAFVHHPTIPTYVAGCRRRAESLGYFLDDFWLHDPRMDGNAMCRVFHARNIRGVVIVGLMDENRLPSTFLPVIERYPCVVTGVSTRDPALSYACVDHHRLTLEAMEQVRALGYRRPGLVLDRVIDALVSGRFTAGYLVGQRHLPSRDRLPPFYDVAEARRCPALFYEWKQRYRPDVIFTLYNVVQDWVEAEGLRVPDDLGLVQLEVRASQPEWAGMNQHNDLVGEAAMDMLVGMIHRGEKGAPEFPRATLIGATWRDGTTVRLQQCRSGRAVI